MVVTYDMLEFIPSKLISNKKMTETIKVFLVFVWLLIILKQLSCRS